MNVNTSPFPYIIMENALSEADYIALEAAWPADMEVSQSGLKENFYPPEPFPWQASIATMLQEAFNIGGRPTNGRFMLRKAGYELPPHWDPPNFLATILHYMPYPGQAEGMGTVLYKAKYNQKQIGDGAQYFSRWHVGRRLVVPYRRNLVLAFKNSSRSAHGLDKLKEDRRAFQWHIER